jgi:nucleoside-diphosphate-sugar epimerase
MKIFITGATGYVGGHLVNRLIEQGHFLNVLVRSPEKNRHLKNSSISIFEGGILEKESIKKAMTGCEYVFHLAACTSIWLKNEEDYFNINVTGTNNVLDIAYELGIKKTVVTSTAGVFGPSINKTVTETTERDIPYFNNYEKSKALSEKSIKQYVHEKDMDIVIVSPTRIYGPFLNGNSFSFTLLIEKYIAGNWKFIPGNGEKIGNYIFIDDVVNGHIQAMNIGLKGESYLLAGVNCTYNEFFKILKKASGKNYKLFHTPLWIQLFFGYIQLFKASIFKISPSVVPKWIKRGNFNWEVSSKKMNEKLHIETTSLEDGIKKTVLWATHPK